LPSRIKLILILVLMVVTVLGVYLSLAERGERLRLPPDEEAEEEPNSTAARQIFYRSELTVYSADEREHWVMNAEVLRRFDENELVEMEEIDARAFEEEKPVLHLVAESGQAELDGELEFYAPLTARSLERDAVLEADVLRWDPETGLLTAVGDVHLTRSGSVLRADRLTADQGLEVIEAENEVWSSVEGD